MANRRERRWQLRATQMLKVKNMFGPFTELGKLWYNKTRTEGAELHRKNTKAVQDAFYEVLSDRETKLIELYAQRGYSKDKIKLLVEAWQLTTVKNKDTYREDKKEARRLRREAENMQ